MLRQGPFEGPFFCSSFCGFPAITLSSPAILNLAPASACQPAWKWCAMLHGAKRTRPDLDDALDFCSHDRENAGEAQFFDDEKAMAKSTNIASNINQKIIRAAVEK